MVARPEDAVLKVADLPHGRIGEGVQKRSTRKVIVEAAKDVFAELGCDGASVRDIARRVGISKGNLTYHFATKDDLLYEVMADMHDMFLVTGQNWLNIEGEPDEILRRAFREHVELICVHASNVRVVFEGLRRLSPDHRTSITTKRDRYEGIFRELIARYQPALGSADSQLNLLRTRAVLGMVNWPYQWYSAPGDVTPADLGEMMSGMAIESLAVRPA